jgi:MinD-like ATPase involved in chromosome partitioning or flagellar assembly
MARTPVSNAPHQVAVTTAKGGEGKTTTTLFLASQLGLARGDRLITVECNPHHGTFRQRVPMHHERGVKDFLLELNQLERDEDLTAGMLSRHVTNWEQGRLSVMASPMDPADLDALTDADYRRLLRALYRFYDLLFLDTGTGLRDPWTTSLLGEIADQVVVVAQASRDGAALADHTFDYLVSLRGTDWVRERVVVVVNQVAPNGILSPGELQKYFATRGRRALTVRYDRHLAAGGWMDWSEMDSGTKDDYLTLAAEVGSGFTAGCGGGL